MRPVHIEYHFSVLHHGYWSQHYGHHPVGTSFAKVFANGWAFAEVAKSDGVRWTSYAWPGCYPMYYLVADMEVICPVCANDYLARTLDPEDTQWHIVGSAINDEDQDMYCVHCNKHMEPSCGFDEITYKEQL